MTDSLCTCGAMLPLPDLAGLVTCPSCGRVTRVAPGQEADGGDVDAEAGSSAWPEPPVAAPSPGIGWGAPAPVPGAPSAPAAPPPGAAPPGAGSGGRRSLRSSSSKSLLGCLPVLVFVVVAGVVVSALRGCDAEEVRSSIGLPSGSDITVLGGGATLLDLAGDGTDLIVVTQELDGTGIVRRLARVRVGGESARQVWQSEPVADDAYQAEVAVVGDVLFAGIDDGLLALELDTGETRWRTTLSDSVTTGCPSCLAAVDDVLLVRTADAYVTGFGPGSAEPRWTRRLRSTVGSVSVASGQALIVDDPEDPTRATPVELIDPATGRTVRSVTPSCPRSDQVPWTVELSAGDPVLPVAGTDDVVAVYGFGDGCATRWSPSSGEVRWTVRVPEISSFRVDDGVVGASDLVVPTTSGRLVSIALADGASRSLDPPSDARISPNLIVGRTLLADYATTRGTTRHGLASYDLATGVRGWTQSNPENAEPVSRGPYRTTDALFEGSPRQLLVPDGDRLWALVFDGGSASFQSRAIDLVAGSGPIDVQRGFVRAYESGTPSMTVTGVDGGRAFVTIDSVLQAIPGSGRGPIVAYPDPD